MNCPDCNAKLAVIETRDLGHGLAVWRRRRCSECRSDHTTWESFSPTAESGRITQILFDDILLDNPSRAEALATTLTQAALRFSLALEAIAQADRPRTPASPHSVVSAIDTLLHIGADDVVDSLKDQQSPPAVRERLWRLRCLVEDLSVCLGLERATGAFTAARRP
jgi:hypothetical protein